MKTTVQNGWNIRRATEADESAIARFHEMQQRPKRSDSVTSEYFIAEGSEDIIGCVAVRAQGQVGYLYGLTVDKSWRRRGIGHGLAQQGLDALSEAGVDSVFALVMFWNIRFFKSHRFALADRLRKRELGSLHQDFTDKWSARSVLLVANLGNAQLPSL